MSTDSHSQLTHGGDAQFTAYHPLSKLAVLGLIFGVLAMTALVDPFLWLVPAVGILINVLALWTVERNAPELLGRNLALVGLALSILFGVAAPAQRYGYRFMLDREARQFGEAWFEFLCRGEVLKAHQLTRHPNYRQPLDDRLPQFYNENPLWLSQLSEYREEPLIRFLAKRGKKVLVRYDRTRSFGRTRAGEDVVYPVYAVTYDDAGERKSFFVSLKLHRVKLEDGQANWMLSNAQGDGLPEEP